MQMKRFKLFFLPLSLLILLLATPGFADVIFELGNHPQSDEENILFSADQTGTTITGITNTSNTLVDFSSITDTLEATASGQADVTSLDGLINNITISLPGGGTYLDMILNPQTKEHDEFPVSVTVLTNLQSAIYSFDIQNGSNFLTIYTTGGEIIQSTTLDTEDGFESLKQPRISGVSGGIEGPTPVPEPASLLLLGSGLSLIGLAAWRRKK